MLHDQPGPITLAIADCQLDLQVLGFTGREALNETWCFTIDLVSRNPHLDIGATLQRPACFKPATRHPGICGEVISVRQIYAGTCLSHYRISLGPRLQRLAQPQRQRLFQNLNAPQLIERLLLEHGFVAGDYRFETLSGLYPPRPLCVQHQESDLHLLQRLCEEEGIHFRFDGMQLVFADDSAHFPERSSPLRFVASGPEAAARGRINHLAEHPALEPVRITTFRQPGDLALPTEGARKEHPGLADNQPLTTAVRPPSVEPSWQRQNTVRQLERLRCEARRIQGNSAEPTLTSGQVAQVVGHPEALFNDYWLLTRVQHVGKQPGVLEGHDPHDIATIVQNLAAITEPNETFEHGYRNSFAVIAWTQPFRPPLRHEKPSVHSLQTATLLGIDIDSQGCLPVRPDWQPASLSAAEWLRVPWLVPPALQVRNLSPGCQVLLGHLDNDPDRPVICAVPDPAPDTPSIGLQLDGHELTPVPSTLHLQAGQQLHIKATGSLKLESTRSILKVSPQAIELYGQSNRPIVRRSAPHAPGRSELPDLRLLHQGSTLSRCIWYIVRMSEPGLEYLSRLDPEHFLFEGRTDEQGYLGLSPLQRRELALEYARTPHDLCLIHPGRCIMLRQYLHQSGHEAQHQALLDSAWRQTETTPP